MKSTTEFCIGWGRLFGSVQTHPDCPVVLLDNSESAVSLDGFAFPVVCPCECRVCKRAWWASDRPRISNGQIETSHKTYTTAEWRSK